MTHESLLSLLRDLVAAHDAKRYNEERCAYTLLVDAVRAMPSWSLPEIAEPAAEVERELTCGTRLSLRNEDGNLVLVVCDHDGEILAPVLTEREAVQMRGDLQRVIAALGGAR
jgi:hypothetical protein